MLIPDAPQFGAAPPDLDTICTAMARETVLTLRRSVLWLPEYHKWLLALLPTATRSVRTRCRRAHEGFVSLS